MSLLGSGSFQHCASLGIQLNNTEAGKFPKTGMDFKFTLPYTKDQYRKVYNGYPYHFLEI